MSYFVIAKGAALWQSVCEVAYVMRLLSYVRQLLHALF